MAASLSTEIFKEVLIEILRKKFPYIESLTEEQFKAAWYFIKCRDTFAILPTGHGKSLLFQLIPDLCRSLNALNYSQYPEKAILLVICPLNSLIQSHLKEVDKYGISASCLSSEDVDEIGIFNGKYSIIFC